MAGFATQRTFHESIVVWQRSVLRLICDMVRTGLRIAFGALMLLAGLHAHVFAQERAFGVHGRILDSSSGSPIRGAAVELGGIGAVLSDSTGQFHFVAVPRGRYSLTVRQLGYASQEIALLLRSDTTLTIGLPWNQCGWTHCRLVLAA